MSQLFVKMDAEYMEMGDDFDVGAVNEHLYEIFRDAHIAWGVKELYVVDNDGKKQELPTDGWVTVPNRIQRRIDELEAILELKEEYGSWEDVPDECLEKYEIDCVQLEDTWAFEDSLYWRIGELKMLL